MSKRPIISFLFILHHVTNLEAFLWWNADATLPENNIGICSTSTVCYRFPLDVGCFEQGGHTPFCPQIVQPEDPALVMPQFELYTSEFGPRNGQRIDPYRLDESIDQLRVNRSQKLFVLIHGFSTNTNIEWELTLKDVLIAREISVITTNWTAAAKGPNYLQAAANTRMMGRIVALLLDKIRERHGIDPKTKVTLIGFSLGAHVAGFAGEATPGRVARIIGLDPAGPLFETALPRARLDETDAHYVQVIHTSGDSILKGGAGTMLPMGHADFYPNGGKSQPGCSVNSMAAIASDIWQLNYTRLFESAGCTHYRSVFLLLSAVENGDDLDHLLSPYAFNKKSDCSYIGVVCEDSSRWLDGLCYKRYYAREDYCRFDLTGHSGRKCNGSYFFNTVNGTDDTESYKEVTNYCGKQYGLRMKFDNLVIGQVTMKFINERNQTSTYQLQRLTNKLWTLKQVNCSGSNIFNGKVVRELTLPQSFGPLRAVAISYEPISAWLVDWAVGKFTIASIEMVDITKRFTYQTTTPVEVTSNGTSVAELSAKSVIGRDRTRISARLPQQVRNLVGFGRERTRQSRRPRIRENGI